MLVSDIPDREKAIEQLKAGICPYCEEGPFKMVLSHISKTHGFRHHDVKDCLLLSKSASFVDEKLSKHFSSLASDLYSERVATYPNFGKGRKQEFSILAKQKMRQRMIGKPALEKAKLSAAMTRKLSDIDVLEIRSLLNQNVPKNQIAKLFSVCRTTIRKIHLGISYKDTLGGNSVNK